MKEETGIVIGWMALLIFSVVAGFAHYDGLSVAMAIAGSTILFSYVCDKKK